MAGGAGGDGGVWQLVELSIHIQVSDFNHLGPVCGGEVLLSTANSPNLWPVARSLIQESDEEGANP